jgi:hypothetical protein
LFKNGVAESQTDEQMVDKCVALNNGGPFSMSIETAQAK